MAFRGCRCVFEVLLCYLGNFRREEVWEEKGLDSEAKKKSLFVEEMKQQPLVANRRGLAPPCANKLLIFNKSLQELVTLRVFEVL